ncbi:hypothetical protein E2562_013261 [Oryza meyeriana var. granulata]|uniref:Uncharacterized protein n=1 Tax=Oryza meyeriana var. granulata TaxID=110450 RepID=A0A6G1D393_9ORYZ|nr:hypothetical protein E2562_013261 [Oryza meyeriana var. granulata]
MAVSTGERSVEGGVKEHAAAIGVEKCSAAVGSRSSPRRVKELAEKVGIGELAEEGRVKERAATVSIEEFAMSIGVVVEEDMAD